MLSSGGSAFNFPFKFPLLDFLLNFLRELMLLVPNALTILSLTYLSADQMLRCNIN